MSHIFQDLRPSIRLVQTLPRVGVSFSGTCSVWTFCDFRKCTTEKEQSDIRSDFRGFKCWDIFPLSMSKGLDMINITVLNMNLYNIVYIVLVSIFFTDLRPTMRLIECKKDFKGIILATIHRRSGHCPLRVTKIAASCPGARVFACQWPGCPPPRLLHPASETKVQKGPLHAAAAASSGRSLSKVTKMTWSPRTCSAPKANLMFFQLGTK